MTLRKYIFILFLLPTFLFSQQDLSGVVRFQQEEIPFAKIKLPELHKYTLTDDNGYFELLDIPEGKYKIEVYAVGYELFSDSVTIPSEPLMISLSSSTKEIEGVVISASLEEISKKASTINVEVYDARFFKKNPTSSVYDALQNINGVRPQLNCNICNTGDIHMNGLEGAYTMVLIDGMPIVSSLSTVYGLFGIPNSIIDRIEIVKGPSSALYGSEAIGGIINVITKSVEHAPVFALEAMTDSWLQTTVDVSLKSKVGNKAAVLNGLNYHNYSTPIDQNGDGFTDVTLQHRISIFQKWDFNRKKYRLFTIAGRYLYEDRWGGEMNWTPEYRGGDSIYAESIYTSRFELLAKYQLPFKEKIMFTTSMNKHHQNSFYGTTSFNADQVIAFGQLHWSKKWSKHSLLSGFAMRYTYYDDNTTSTETGDSIVKNEPSSVFLPGFFLQDEWSMNDKHKSLFGIRFDHHSLHGIIITPRIGYKWDPLYHSNIRINAGSGYRVVNIYTEDHAALTGAREVSIADDIEPEQSYNVNLNYYFDLITTKESRIIADLTLYYTYFTNKIITDYDTDPNKILYYNSPSYAINKGASINVTYAPSSNLKFTTGFSIIDLAFYENSIKKIPALTEKFNGTWTISYSFKYKIGIDYTGNVYSPMRLPLLNELDPRPEYSPWWSIQNVKISYGGLTNWEIFGGVKNLLNWTPDKHADFLIARAHDPFDKQVQFDTDGNPVPTSENPYGLTFDPSYVFAPNQGIRFFIGISYSIKGK